MLLLCRINTRHQPASPLEQGELDFDATSSRRPHAQAEMEPFFDQPREARALVRSQCLGLRKQLIVDVERGLHAATIQISVWIRQ